MLSRAVRIRSQVGRVAALGASRLVLPAMPEVRCYAPFPPTSEGATKMNWRALLAGIVVLWMVTIGYFVHIATEERSDCAAKGGELFADGCYRVTKEKMK